MAGKVLCASLILWGCIFLPSLPGADPDRDFSGKWTLDAAASRWQDLDQRPERVLIIVYQDTAIHCSDNATFSLDGSETKYRIGEATHSSAVKWEGAALLINTLVSGPRNYTIMDRWKLSRDHNTLTITRQIVSGMVQSEGSLVYRGDGWVAPGPAPTIDAAPRPMLIRPQPRASSPAPEDATVVAGTHIALALRNTVDTKHSKEGDRIYLETIYPVAVNGRMVVPRGSFVNGTITLSKAAGVRSKGELFIRFDSLTLPSGATRDFRSRIASAEGTNVDGKEGKVTGERDTGKDVGTVAGTTVMGASLGGLIGRSMKGVGIGSAAGAAVGLGTILMKKGPQATLHQGTTLDMILDRDVTFTAAELRW
ncbi:MAG: hypothetical protein ABI806_26065 [Candidatus Solibacter sp.]